LGDVQWGHLMTHVAHFVIPETVNENIARTWSIGRGDRCHVGIGGHLVDELQRSPIFKHGGLDDFVEYGSASTHF